MFNIKHYFIIIIELILAPTKMSSDQSHLMFQFVLFQLKKTFFFNWFDNFGICRMKFLKKYITFVVIYPKRFILEDLFSWFSLEYLYFLNKKFVFVRKSILQILCFSDVWTHSELFDTKFRKIICCVHVYVIQYLDLSMCS